MTPDPSTYLRALRRDSRRSLITCVIVLAMGVAASLSSDPVGRVLGIVAVLGAVLFAGFAIRQMRDPRQHPAFERLRVYGDPEMIAAHLSVEMERATPILGAWVGREWLVIAGPAGPDGVRPADVLGVYHRIQENWIRSMRWDDAVIVTRRREYTIRGRPAEVEALVEAVHAAAPWALTGKAEELRAIFRGAERNGTIQRVDARRRTMLPG
jgi:hypothetical protein